MSCYRRTHLRCFLAAAVVIGLHYQSVAFASDETATVYHADLRDELMVPARLSWDEAARTQLEDRASDLAYKGAAEIVVHVLAELRSGRLKLAPIAPSLGTAAADPDEALIASLQIPTVRLARRTRDDYAAERWFAYLPEYLCQAGAQAGCDVRTITASGSAHRGDDDQGTLEPGAKRPAEVPEGRALRFRLSLLNGGGLAQLSVAMIDTGAPESPRHRVRRSPELGRWAQWLPGRSKGDSR